MKISVVYLNGEFNSFDLVDDFYVDPDTGEFFVIEMDDFTVVYIRMSEVLEIYFDASEDIE